MQIDGALLDGLLREAEAISRRRMNFDLRTTPEDGSQRMLNAIMPDSDIPIHRHNDTAETVLILVGKAYEAFYDDNGNESSRVWLDASESKYGVQVPAGAWHALKAVTPCVIFEAKNGPYNPASPAEILH